MCMQTMSGCLSDILVITEQEQFCGLLCMYICGDCGLHKVDKEVKCSIKSYHVIEEVNYGSYLIKSFIKVVHSPNQ